MENTDEIWTNLSAQIDVAREQPFKKDLLTTDSFNVALVSLGKNQEIPPHPESYAVFFLVLEGSGTFLKKGREVSLEKQGSLYYEKNEQRGIKSDEKLILLGIQEPH